jgi:hypothetical protein
METLTFDTLDERYFGTLSQIKQIEISKKYFLQFSNQTRSFHTLLLCSNTEQSLLELKVKIPSILSLILRIQNLGMYQC